MDTYYETFSREEAIRKFYAAKDLETKFIVQGLEKNNQWDL